jgi:hypothetical protein
MLANISQHPDIVKSRFYQTKWEEIIRLFITALEKGLISAFIPGNYYVDPSHTCMSMFEGYQSCVSCEEDISFANNFEKIYSLEEELWVNYVAYKTSSSTNDCTFDSFIFFQKNQGNLENFEEINIHQLNNFENYYQNQIPNQHFLFDNFGQNYNQNCAENININIDFSKPPIHQMIFENDNHGNSNINGNLKQNNGAIHFTSSNAISPQMSCTSKHNKTSFSQADLVQHSKSNESHFFQHQSNSIVHMNSETSSIAESSTTKAKRQKFMVNKNPITSQKEVKPKIKIQFFKDFNVKFTKRENIDKKILRKFRKFLKDKNKKNMISLDNLNINKVFWSKFIIDNLLPPMKYQPENVEYKSFNTNYMVWLMAHKGGVELYDYFVNENFESIISMFITKFNLKEGEELQQLRIYVKNLATIFYAAANDKDSTLTEVSEEEVVTTIKKDNNTICDTYNCIEDNNFTHYNQQCTSDEAKNPIHPIIQSQSQFPQLQNDFHCLNGINSNMNNFDIFNVINTK